MINLNQILPPFELSKSYIALPGAEVHQQYKFNNNNYQNVRFDSKLTL